MLFFQIANMYQIPKSTISDELKRKHPGHHGGQTILTVEKGKKKKIVEGLLKCAEWGLPLRILDVQFLVQGYLNRFGRAEKRFRNNCPGCEWCRLFL